MSNNILKAAAKFRFYDLTMAWSTFFISLVYFVRKHGLNISLLLILQNKIELVKKRNKFIMDLARCMLHEKNLPRMFWTEAANTAVFLQNQLPSKTVKDKTPFEA